ncbi:MAG TPA: glutamate racemase [Clostridiales bacterium]|nr:glutamate racemase [Clostridiales bacterium]
MDNRPIGVFDSGLGGLTVVKSIIDNLPNEDIIYLGDTARVPYGGRSHEMLTSFVHSDFAFLLSKEVKAIVIACNTADSQTRTVMEKYYNIPIVGVVEPAGKQAAEYTKTNEIGIIGTSSTVESNAYPNIIKKYNPDVKVIQVACPLLAPLVENEKTSKDDIVLRKVLSEYLMSFQNTNIDTLILGCTHYPLIRDAIAEFLPDVRLISSGFASTHTLIDLLDNNNLRNGMSHPGRIKYYVTDAPEKFAHSAEMFLSMPISKVELVKI